MKKILAVLLVGLTPFLGASDTANGNYIEDISKYEKIYQNDVYNFYIRSGELKVGPEQYLIHTMVEYITPDGLEYAELGYSVKRIYNYGMLDCDLRVMNLFSDVFTNEKNEVVYSESYEIGEFKSELMTPNTARNAVYKKVCIEYL